MVEAALGRDARGHAAAWLRPEDGSRRGEPPEPRGGGRVCTPCVVVQIALRLTVLAVRPDLAVEPGPGSGDTGASVDTGGGGGAEEQEEDPRISMFDARGLYIGTPAELVADLCLHTDLDDDYEPGQEQGEPGGDAYQGSLDTDSDVVATDPEDDRKNSLHDALRRRLASRADEWASRGSRLLPRQSVLDGRDDEDPGSPPGLVYDD